MWGRGLSALSDFSRLELLHVGHTLDVSDTPLLHADVCCQCVNVVWPDLVLQVCSCGVAPQPPDLCDIGVAHRDGEGLGKNLVLHLVVTCWTIHSSVFCA